MTGTLHSVIEIHFSRARSSLTADITSEKFSNPLGFVGMTNFKFTTMLNYILSGTDNTTFIPNLRRVMLLIVYEER